MDGLSLAPFGPGNKDIVTRDYFKFGLGHIQACQLFTGPFHLPLCTLFTPRDAKVTLKPN